jgi:hypothetical protein
MDSQQDILFHHLDGAIGMSSSIDKIVLPPLIHLIMEYARPLWLFVEHKTKKLFIYDHLTRQIVHSESIPYLDAVLVSRASDRALFILTSFWDTNDYRVHIHRVEYDLKRLALPWNFHEDAPISETLSNYRIDAFVDEVVRNGESIFIRYQDGDGLSKYYWSRFDLQTQKWDTDHILDTNREFRMSDTPSMSATSIGQRSFMAIERFYNNVFRCSAYDCESKIMIHMEPIKCPETKTEDELNVSTLGHIKDDHNDMVVVVFTSGVIFQMGIKTRRPSLTFHPTVEIKPHTNIEDQYGAIDYLVFDSILWAFVKQRDGQPLLCFHFSFETLTWIQSGHVPHCLFFARFYTMI